MFNLQLPATYVEPSCEDMSLVFSEINKRLTLLTNLLTINNSLIKYGKTPVMMDLVGHSMESAGITVSIEGIGTVISDIIKWIKEKLMIVVNWIKRLFGISTSDKEDLKDNAESVEKNVNNSNNKEAAITFLGIDVKQAYACNHNEYLDLFQQLYGLHKQMAKIGCGSSDQLNLMETLSATITMETTKAKKIYNSQQVNYNLGDALSIHRHYEEILIKLPKIDVLAAAAKDVAYNLDSIQRAIYDPNDPEARIRDAKVCNLVLDAISSIQDLHSYIRANVKAASFALENAVAQAVEQIA